jgi:MFS family permease
VALFAVASFVETLGFGHLGAFTPLYLRELGVEPSAVPQWTGLLSAASFAIGLPLAPMWGVWADRYSQKLVIVRSTIGEGVIFLLFAVSGSPWHLLAARMLVGFILGNTGVMYAVLADRAPPQRLPLAIGLVGAGSTLGVTAGAFVGGWLVLSIGLSRLFLLDAVAAWAVAAVLVAGLSDRPRPRTGGSSWALLRALPRNFVASPRVPWLFGLYFLVLLGANMQGPFVPLLVEAVYAGLDVSVAIGFVLFVAGVLSAASQPVLGWLAGAWGSGRVLAAALLLGAGATAMQALASEYWIMLLARSGFGASHGGAGPVVVSLIAAATPQERRSSVLNMILFPAYFTWLFGSLVGAGLAGFEVRLVFIVAAAVLLVSAAAAQTLVAKEES